MVAIWTNGAASPRGILRVARDIEEQGWDGLCVVDSQNLSGDPYVALAMAATVTERIGLGTAVTNSVTRQAAVTATSIASVDRVANGRAVLGIGRGDSALAHLGRAPGRVKHFETYVRHLGSYLRGEAVPFSEIEMPDSVAPPLTTLGLANAPDDSRIGWLKEARKISVEVAASGPRVIEIAAVHCERVMFTLGADVTRLAWGIEVAKAARQKAGLDPDGIKFGAYVNCICHPDIETARDLVKGGLTTFARFSVMHGKTTGPVSLEMEKALQTLRAAYDMRKHTRRDSGQAATLTPEFIDHFAIVGAPDHCIERLSSLAALGIDKISLGGNINLTETQAGIEAKALVEKEVIPVMQAL